jgi:hypothetical protein
VVCQCDFFKGPLDNTRCGSPATKFFRNNGGISKQIYYARCGAHIYRMERTKSFEPLTREEYVVACVMES